MNVQLNLLPDVKKEFIKAQKTKAVVISGSIITALVAFALSLLLFLYVTLGQQLQISIITSDIESKTEELNGIQDLSKYLTIQNQLKSLPDLHDQKGIYSRLFQFLPILNPSPPNNVTLSTLQVSSTDQSVILSGTTATFESLNIFVDTLNNAEASYKESGVEDSKKDKIFSGVYVQSSSLSRLSNVTKVSFVLSVNYNEMVFDARNSEVKASVPNIETTPSVTGSPTIQLFDESNGGQ